MQLGINTFLFASPFDHDACAFFTVFKTWGFDSVEIALEDPTGINPAVVRAALDGAGLACHSVCAAMSPDRDLRGTPLQQQTARQYLETLIDLMPTLGAGVLCGPLYSSVGRADAVPPDEQETQLQTVSAHLQALGARAEARAWCWPWSRSTGLKPIFSTPSSRACGWSSASTPPPWGCTSTRFT